jgi:hypothetical protein
VLEVDKQIKQLLGQSDSGDSDAADASEDEEDWELPIPDYIFSERARLVENFYGPGAEDFGEEKLLARRIQVTKDLVALSQLCQPARRGKRVQWDMVDTSDQTKSEEPLCVEEETLVCPTNVCILCYGLSRDSPSLPPPHRFPSKRLDSFTSSFDRFSSRPCARWNQF